jgi:hypothetical protein
MIRPTILVASLSALLLTGIPLQTSLAGDEAGLVTWMGRLQYYTHKLGLAVAAQNRALQGYYVHELEEVIEHIEGIQEVDGIEIGNLVKANLVPAFETLESAVEVGDQSRVDLAYGGLIGACNTCHKAANRPYVHIVRRADNPYLQDFAPIP